MEILSDDDDEEDVITIPDDVYKPLSLEKMVALISLLVEKSRSAEDNNLQISDRDYNAIIGTSKVHTGFSPWWLYNLYMRVFTRNDVCEAVMKW